MSSGLEGVERRGMVAAPGSPRAIYPFALEERGTEPQGSRRIYREGVRSVNKSLNKSACCRTVRVG